MTGGELTILITALIGFAGTLVQQWATNAKATRAAQDLVDIREQDRLDREQIARSLLEQQRFELEKMGQVARSAAEVVKRQADKTAADIKHRMELTAAEVKQQTESAAEAVRRQLEINERSARMQRASTTRVIEEALAKNSELTQVGVDKADAAFREANNINQKLEKLGVDNLASQSKQEETGERVEDIVSETQEQVADVHDAIVDDKRKS